MNCLMGYAWVAEVGIAGSEFYVLYDNFKISCALAPNHY